MGEENRNGSFLESLEVQGEWISRDRKGTGVAEMTWKHRSKLVLSHGCMIILIAIDRVGLMSRFQASPSLSIQAMIV